MLSAHNIIYALKHINDIFPNEVSRSAKVIWYPSSGICISHLLYNTHLIHEQTGAFSRKAAPLSSNR